MGFLDKLFKKLSAGTIESDYLTVVVRCARCGEEIEARVNLNNDLSFDESNGKEGYICRKGVMGSGAERCYEKFELILYFDRDKHYLNCDIAGKAVVISVN